jgi:DNA-binding NtrC family response regulator
MRAEDITPLQLIRLDPATGLPYIGPTRVTVLGAPAVGRLVADLIQTVGLDQMSVIFARFGYEAGMALAMNLAELFSFDTPLEWLKAAAVVTTASGQAQMVFDDVRMDSDRRVLSFSGAWRHSLAALNWKQIMGAVPAAVCASLAGMLSGYASVVWGSEVWVVETACAAQEGSECRFEGRPVADWGLTVDQLLQTYSLEPLEKEISRLRRNLAEANAQMTRQAARIESFGRRKKPAGPSVIHAGPAMIRLLERADKVAPSEATVLIQGETGSGKEVLARYIHGRSGRAGKPFLAINCAALPPALLESELFGHKKGAFTGAYTDKIGLFETASGGTLFLDEIGEIPIELQAKLLRAVQNREVRPVGGGEHRPFDARMMAATNRNLEALVASGGFREDLYYRLAVFPLTVPPLRDRKPDIPLLARHFLQNRRPGHPGLTVEAARVLEAYAWPGNVRELESWMEHALVLAGDERIAPEHLPDLPQTSTASPLTDLIADQPTLDILERRYIQHVIAQSGGRRAEAARRLGLSPSTLYRRLREEEK